MEPFVHNFPPKLYGREPRLIHPSCGGELSAASLKLLRQ